ncbi:MAG TPA: DUF885 family protein [Blastocatellia bacterium]|nr:DUF885 family protein [Blastocatellia bacterium]
MKKSICHTVVCLLTVTALSHALWLQPAQAQAARADGEADVSPSEMRSVIERYTTDRASLNRSYAVPLSATRQARFKQFYSDWLAELARLDFERMSLAGRVDYLLFKNHLEHELRQLEMEARQLAEMEPLLPFAKDLLGLEEARRRMAAVNAEETAALLTRLVKQIDGLRKTLEAALKPEAKTGIKKTVANRAVLTVNNMRETLKAWFGFYNGYDPVFTWWVGEPYKQLDKALQEYGVFLREKLIGVKADDATVIIGDPIGRDALLSELAYEMIPYTPEELIAIAKKEMDWCEAELIKAARAMGYGDDWRKALEHVKTLHVEPGRQPDLIRQLALEAIDFVDQHDLVTVPQLARETWRMEMMTPERQLVSPFFLGGEVIQVSYPTNTMSHEQKLMSMRGNNIHFARATVFHELIPGHHLQGFMAQRYRAYRAIFGTPFWTEGWSLYWEMLLWDMNFAKSPENRIGMLFWRMHRSARIMFSLGFHLEQMTPQQCIDLLVNRVGHEVDNATAEVRRSFNGTYGPLYQCAYLLGGLQFRALHKDLVESGRLSNRQFHDAILRENRIPVEMVRAILTAQPLTRDFSSSWKFYGPNPAAR